MAGGEDEEFEAFCRQQLQQLKRLLLTMAFSEVVAEDATQEALCLAYKYWDTIDYPDAWVRTTARRLAIRETQRTRTLVSLQDDWLPDAEDSAFAHWPSIKPDHYPVLEAVRSLPDHQRFVMAYTIRGFEPQEIADELGMNPATVRSHLRHARTKLRDRFSEGGEFFV